MSVPSTSATPTAAGFPGFRIALTVKEFEEIIYLEARSASQTSIILDSIGDVNSHDPSDRQYCRRASLGTMNGLWNV